MRPISSPETVTDHGDHVVISADTYLQEQALRPGSPADIALMLANAETALGALRDEFELWMEQEAARLGPLLEDYLADSSQGQKHMLYRALHDIRGNASSFGNALAGQIADHMCKLFDAAGSVPAAMVEAHIHAIQAVVREKALTGDHPVGGAIIKELVRAATALAQAKQNDTD